LSCGAAVSRGDGPGASISQLGGPRAPSAPGPGPWDAAADQCRLQQTNGQQLLGRTAGLARLVAQASAAVWWEARRSTALSTAGGEGLDRAVAPGQRVLDHDHLRGTFGGGLKASGDAPDRTVAANGPASLFAGLHRDAQGSAISALSLPVPARAAAWCLPAFLPSSAAARVGASSGRGTSDGGLRSSRRATAAAYGPAPLQQWVPVRCLVPGHGVATPWWRRLGGYRPALALEQAETGINGQSAGARPTTKSPVELHPLHSVRR